MDVNCDLKTVKSAALFLLLSALTGCAAGNSSRVAAPGESVGVQFTCRLADGEVAVSTKADAGSGEGERRSVLFFPREMSDPIILSAGEPDPLSPTKVRPLEEDVLQQLRGKVVGMKTGETREVKLHAMRLSGAAPRDGIVKYNRVRHFTKEERISAASFKKLNAKDPVPGEPCSGATHEHGFKGEVASVSGDEVLIRYSIIPGAKVPVFFGTGVITDGGGDYQMRIDTEVGRLVRDGYLSGRVVQVSEGIVAIDFADQYGGETLTCQVTVESVEPSPASVPGTLSEGATSAAGTAKE